MVQENQDWIERFTQNKVLYSFKSSNISRKKDNVKKLNSKSLKKNY